MDLTKPRRSRQRISHARLLELLWYDQNTGVFTWRASREHCRPGAPAGYLMPVGYLSICLDGRKYYGHRLAWLYVHGTWPVGVIDHINHNKSDNSICNLRDVSIGVNLQNRVGVGKLNTTGALGVSMTRSGKFRASIKVLKTFKHLGVFDTAEQAGAAYVKAKAEYHAGFIELSGVAAAGHSN